MILSFLREKAENKEVSTSSETSSPISGRLSSEEKIEVKLFKIPPFSSAELSDFSHSSV